MNNKQYYVYIMTIKSKTVLYTGVTNDLIRRVYQHKSKVFEGFTSKYNVDQLVYYEIHQDIKLAIEREKQVKAGPRRKKLELIHITNHDWSDLCGALR
ncbi:MAG TPA: endonuclease [Sporomusaceae bacterium]|uniref:GIY-YIG nuclease family protein n=1 Tax=Anaerospora sp. TaxID=1960278 RepID=UPI000ED33D47|nr:GIY-YIG nuclease family protein [Anaerospora sp.]HAK74605.1 endonuclease [Sporomusaceae bacterium]